MEGALPFAVNGALMRGLERNGNLVQAGAAFDREARTAPSYRLWSIDDVLPAMLHVASGGRSIAVEIWLVPPAGVAAIQLAEPPGPCVGRLTLDDRGVVLGVLGEPHPRRRPTGDHRVRRLAGVHRRECSGRPGGRLTRRAARGPRPACGMSRG
jgi:hypothetical protein